MIKVKDTKRCEIKNRIVQLEGVRLLCKLLDEQKNSNEGQVNLCFTITYKDHSVTESSDKEIFWDDSITNSKPISSIKLEFYEFSIQKKVEIYFSSGCYSHSHFKVSGDDGIWVRGLFDKIQQIIQSFPPQPPLCVINYIFVELTLGLALYVLMLLFFYYLTAAFVTRNLLLLYFFVPALILSFWTADSIKKLFPIVEIQVGAPHTLMEKNWRALLRVIFTAVILPLLITLIYEKFFSIKT